VLANKNKQNSSQNQTHTPLNQKKMTSSSSSSSKQVDFSWILMFPFLKLKELSYISRCSKRFQNMLLEKNTILFMRNHTLVNYVELTHVKEINSKRSPLNNLLTHVKLIIFNPLFNSYNSTHLTGVLHLDIHIEIKQNEEMLGPHTLIENLPESLKSLKIKIMNDHSGHWMECCLEFTNLPKLNDLTYLEITSNHSKTYSIHESFLSNQPNLEELVIDIHLKKDSIYLICERVRTLKKLIKFTGYRFFNLYQVQSLKILCDQPGTPIHLKTIPKITSRNLTTDFMTHQLLHILKLDNIYVSICYNMDITSEWISRITTLELKTVNLNEENCLIISSMPKLRELIILDCGGYYFCVELFKSCMNSLSPTIEIIKIDTQSCPDSFQLFDAISDCIHLTKITIIYNGCERSDYDAEDDCNYLETYDPKFDLMNLSLLKKCSKLSTLNIFILKRYSKFLEFHETINKNEKFSQIPSIIIPSLKNINLEIEYVSMLRVLGFAIVTVTKKNIIVHTRKHIFGFHN
jgi:hypothetical protein